jgi:hypothetical protein
MLRFVVAIAVGVVLAVGATFITTAVVHGIANGTPSNKTLYNYGTR